MIRRGEVVATILLQGKGVSLVWFEIDLQSSGTIGSRYGLVGLLKIRGHPPECARSSKERMKRPARNGGVEERISIVFSLPRYFDQGLK